ncbi:TIGR02757 family protein [Myroides pelagicus]|uniref:TIGR02757 family protein n=1 Tax=Myroides pelagicus TaxID=270914 RepID=A0A7K1GPU9_9FLAO|nr:TIGR02757 family protein [Myroides pelagicus]MEC4114876.1 TIGR02757 family protein [Myroides pelagicus]MTH30234.1 TIGR02757 family protein [Myroides pelagicus]
MNFTDLKEFLDEKATLYNNPSFITDDPIQIPHLYSCKEDIEIAGFLSATIAWGNRKMIIKNAHRMMEFMGNSPYDFVMNHKESQLDSLATFVHRTFNGIDFATFIVALQNLYRNHHGLEAMFVTDANLQLKISEFKKTFFEIEHLPRTQKHISDPLKGSAAKRINMFLRWMVRTDNAGVDLGIWKEISPSLLSCPLDVHSGNVARKLGMLNRKQNDAKALTELDKVLRQMDPIDPAKYDFALFGLGAIEKF